MQSGFTAPSRTRRVSLIFLAALALILTGLAAPAASAVAPSSQPLANKTITAKVDRVLSGERIRVKKGKRKYTVTLADIAAPTGSDCYAKETKSGLQSLLPKGASVIVSVSTKRKRRITGIVYSGSTNINATMVGEGLAESDGGPSDFSSLEAEAAASGKGLHGSCSSSGGGDNSGSAANSDSSNSGNSNSSGSGASSGASNEYTGAKAGDHFSLLTKSRRSGSLLQYRGWKRDGHLRHQLLHPHDIFTFPDNVVLGKRIHIQPTCWNVEDHRSGRGAESNGDCSHLLHTR